MANPENQIHDLDFSYMCDVIVVGGCDACIERFAAFCSRSVEHATHCCSRCFSVSFSTRPDVIFDINDTNLRRIVRTGRFSNGKCGRKAVAQTLDVKLVQNRNLQGRGDKHFIAVSTVSTTSVLAI